MLWYVTQTLLLELRQSFPQLLVILAADGSQMGLSSVVLSWRVTLSKLIGSLQLITGPCPSMNAQSSLSQGRTEFPTGLVNRPLLWPLCHSTHPSVQSYCLHTFAGIESLGTLQKASCMWISTSESVSGGLSMQQFIVFLFCFVVNSKVYPSTSLCVTII